MKEFEITVKLLNGREDIERIMLEKRFIKVEEYELLDTYMVRNDIDLTKMSKREMLDNCVLIREINDDNPKVILTKKIKVYDEKGNTIQRDKKKLNVKSVDESISFLEAIGYRKLMNIKDNIVSCKYDKYEIEIQYVEGLGVFAEIPFEYDENENQDLLKFEVSNMLKNIGFEFENDMDAKKAEMMLDRITIVF